MIIPTLTALATWHSVHTSCIPSHPTPVITIHGTTDAVVSYNGGVPANSESLADIITFWTNYNKTIGLPIISNLPDIDSSDGSTVELSIYDNGENCTSVEHYKVIGGDHDWPGISNEFNINQNSETKTFFTKYDIRGNLDIKMSYEIWNFLNNVNTL